ncbi:hypothetical protein J4E86_005831 [Alternaria arbusti]|uniref:uncharacterized protein n=1 Tax=Alternaria arbusti TaxID=232088 RepID=UPI00221EED42|nr:uncharacterized protein J4E86_005831 [Alternaria arbusti]KAI4954522.1 hypothetical protein J4E86_005831 [Alternaria arbusti]
MSVDEEDSVSEDEDDGVSDDEEDENSEDEDDRLPQEKCGLSDQQYVELLRDDHDGLLEESAQLREEEAGEILEEEATEAAWPTCCPYLTDGLPRELRDMIYGYVFEDSCVQLDAEHSEHACPTTHSQNSYRQLIDFKFFAADTGIKNELAEMWYKMTTFWTTDPSTISSCLSRFKWSAVLEARPFGLVRNVEIWVPVDVTQGILEETPDLARADPLFQLHETTTVRFALGGPDSMDTTFPGRGVPYYNAEDYAENIEYLFPLFANLRAALRARRYRNEHHNRGAEKTEAFITEANELCV